MSARVFQLPELVYEIFEYVGCGVYGQHNLYTCLFVNRQFHEFATRLLYRDLSFSARPSGIWLEDEEKLRILLYQRPGLALHVRTLCLDVTNAGSTYNITLLPFETRIAPILRSCRNLQYVELETTTWKNSQTEFKTILNVLNNIESRPELSFKLYDFHPDDSVEDHDIYERADPILRIKENLRITSLRLDAHWSMRKIQFLAQFRQLESLSLSGRFQSTEGTGWADFETIFEGFPLSRLEVHGPYIIHSFPSNLKSLLLDENLCWPYPLNYLTWRAICRLRSLNELTLENSCVDEWDTPCEFLSSLKYFKASLPSDMFIVRQVLQPILSRSSRLASVKFAAHSSHLSSNLMRCLATTNSGLSRLKVEIYLDGAPYRFRDLVYGLDISSNLTRLNIPWPTSLGEEIEPPERPENQFITFRDGVPERLTFQHCKRLAASFPRLDKIEFIIKKENMATTFSHYWLRGSRKVTTPLQSGKISEWWTTYLERLQSIEMAKFIGTSAPCLNVCTLLFHFEDPDCIKQTATRRYYGEMTIYLSLDQVRRHSGLCGKDCTVLLRDSEALQDWNNWVVRIIERCQLHEKEQRDEDERIERRNQRVKLIERNSTPRWSPSD